MIRQASPSLDVLLVPLDGSPAAEAILSSTVVLAQRLPARVVLLHALEQHAPQRVHGERHLSGEAEAERYLEEIAARLETEHIAATWHVHLTPVGNIPLSIASHAAESGAGLILLAAHGGGSPRSWLSGAVAQGVIRHAGPPVLLLRSDARHGAPFAPEELVVALDRERQAEVALLPASRLAHSLEIPLHLVMVIPTAETLPGDSAVAARLLPSGAAATLDFEAAAAEDYLANLASKMATETADLRIVTHVARGDPAQMLLTHAQSRPSILALATHGRVGLDALWSGSIGSRLIARGNGPFLLVHPAEVDDPQRLDPV